MSKPEEKVADKTVAAKPHDTPDSKRRNFLIGAGLGGAGVAAAVVGGVTGVTPVPGPSAEAAVESKGYRETEHVRRYYGTTRI
jgi:hypothetical protein